MSSLGKYENNYEEIFLFKENNISKLYQGYNKKENRDVCLKIIDKKKLELDNYDLLIEQINREEEIMKLCKSKNILNFYQRFETENSIIFELEYFEIDLKEYLRDNGNLMNNPKFFINIIITLSNVLKNLNSKGIIHRNINTKNIFLKKETDLNSIKLGGFECSTYKTNNKCESLGNIIYSAPEIIKNIKYDEKCDLWSLGITLYELYFGEVPYGINVISSEILEAIYFPEKYFKLKKTNIPTIDFLFEKLLKIDPSERMTPEEFFKYVCNNFINNDKIEQLNKQSYTIFSDSDENEEEEDEQQQIFDKIYEFVKGNHIPDIMNFPNENMNEKKYNNIIYYDENINHKMGIYNDSDLFEKNTNGAFILCTNEISFKIIINEISKKIKEDKRYAFNLITTGSIFKKVMDLLNESKDFEDCIKNYCIYCIKKKEHIHFKNDYPKLHNNIYTLNENIVTFIKETGSEDIKPYPMTRLIKFNDYKERHLKISEYYGDLNINTYEEYLKNKKEVIKEDKDPKELCKNQSILLRGALSFDIKKDIIILNNLITKEYLNNTFYGDLNQWLMNTKMNYYKPIAYYTSRLIYFLNSYANKNNKYYIQEQKIFYKGIKMLYSNLLPYERVKGNIIVLSSFILANEDENYAKTLSGRNDSKKMYENSSKFSVVFNITYYYKNNWISNGIKVNKRENEEKEILFLPFSFYYVKDVKIDCENYTSDIYLETIGKTQILEEEIRKGKIL